jgi:hypothetical protein
MISSTSFTFLFKAHNRSFAATRTYFEECPIKYSLISNFWSIFSSTSFIDIIYKNIFNMISEICSERNLKHSNSKLHENELFAQNFIKN